ncbi:proline racemase family protein [Streptomyces sp. NPDC055082]|uniref:proline racemase family protein n=1 Tax=Streptomyces sp. NPDC055082 TaxID=3365718 RepID=UPI0037CE0467
MADRLRGGRLQDLLTRRPDRETGRAAPPPPARGRRSASAVQARVVRFDRSPCGTGTSARMALPHARGLPTTGQGVVHGSFIGSRSTGRYQAAPARCHSLLPGRVHRVNPAEGPVRRAHRPIGVRPAVPLCPAAARRTGPQHAETHQGG